MKEEILLPDELITFRSLYVICNGDYKKMEWFYENRTYADLTLMICVKNLDYQ